MDALQVELEERPKASSRGLPAILHGVLPRGARMPGQVQREDGADLIEVLGDQLDEGSERLTNAPLSEVVPKIARFAAAATEGDRESKEVRPGGVCVHGVQGTPPYAARVLATTAENPADDSDLEEENQEADMRVTQAAEDEERLRSVRWIPAETLASFHYMIHSCFFALNLEIPYA